MQSVFPKKQTATIKTLEKNANMSNDIQQFIKHKIQLSLQGHSLQSHVAMTSVPLEMPGFFDVYHYLSNRRICTQSQNGLVHQLLDSIRSTTLTKCRTLHSYHASLIVLYQRPGPSSPEKKPLLCYKHQQRTRCTGLGSGLPRNKGKLHYK